MVFLTTLLFYLDYKVSEDGIIDESEMIWNEVVVAWGTISEFAWMGWGRPRKASVWITGVPDDTRNEYLLTRITERYSYGNRSLFVNRKESTYWWRNKRSRGRAVSLDRSRPPFRNSSIVITTSTLTYKVILNYCRGFRAYNFQVRNNKIKLLTEYENVTQKALLLLESIKQNAKQFQYALLSWHIRFQNYRSRTPQQ
jgi:hypothetical protein